MANLEGIRVTAYRYNSATEQWESESYDTTAADGTYDISGLRAGTYKLKFSDSNGNYETEYLTNQIDLDSANSFTVAQGATESGKDAALAAAAHITGTVTDGG